MSRALIVIFVVGVSAGARAQLPASPTDAATYHVIAPDDDLATLTLVRATGGRAVARFGRGSLIVLTIGDRLGKQRAEVTAIDAGRLVLTERPSGSRPETAPARIVIKVGETGGTRFESHALDGAPLLVKPQIAAPAKAASNKPAV